MDVDELLQPLPAPRWAADSHGGAGWRRCLVAQCHAAQRADRRHPLGAGHGAEHAAPGAPGPSELAYDRWRSVIEARPWVTDAAPMASGGVHVRYWLHAVELSPTSFLSAVADIARIAPASASAAGSSFGPTAASTSTPQPMTPPRPATWQTLPTPPPPPHLLRPHRLRSRRHRLQHRRSRR